MGLEEVGKKKNLQKQHSVEIKAFKDLLLLTVKVRPNTACVLGVFLDMSLLWQVIPSSCQLSDRSCQCPKYTEFKGNLFVGGRVLL